MAASLLFRQGKNGGDGSYQATNIQLYSGKAFTLKRTADDQSPSHGLATFTGGGSCMHIDSEIISNNHLRIYTIQYEDGDGVESMYYCEDLGSTNGTRVNNILIGRNNKPSNPFLLSDGDIITVQPGFSFVFKQPIERQRGEMDGIQLAEIATFAPRYTITNRLLGSGIYGKVYLAREVTTKRQLACKVVNLRSFGERRRLMREVDILTKVNHPNIVSMKKAFRSSDNLYLFIELAPGGDLCSFVSANGGSLSDLATRVIMRQIAVAVQYLHSIGIVHRDIKPENILMMNTDVGHRVILTDFGCAAQLRWGGRMESLVGTYDYVAPEVHRELNGASYTKAVDMWSLGIVTLCLLTGESLASYHEMKYISQEGIAAKLGRLSQDPREQVHRSYSTDRTRDFLTKLLTLDPDLRMTADQAVEHSWFAHPSKIALELNLLYIRSIKGWVPRRLIDNVIETIPLNEVLPNQSQANSARPHQPSQMEKRLSRRLKDYTASVYFSLDKHTGKRPDRHNGARESTQRSKLQIINSLKASGELFVKDGDVSSYTSPRRKRARTLLKGFRDVPPTNLFGNAVATANSQRSRSRKTSKKLARHSSNAVTGSDYADSTQAQLELPRLTSEALSTLPSTFLYGISRSTQRSGADTSSNDNWFEELDDDMYTQPDSFNYDTLIYEAGER